MRNTSGMRVAVTVPSSGIDTCQSDSTSSSRASVSTSTRSTSSMSSTTGSSARMASSRGRASRNSSVKMSPSTASHAESRRPLGLDAEELLAVVPLVQGLGLVEALVALEADEAGARPRRRSTWPARSCPCPPAPPPAPACRAGRPARPRRRWRRRPGSRPRPAPPAPRPTTRTAAMPMLRCGSGRRPSRRTSAWSARAGPSGPGRGASGCEIPISAPKPNISPSVKRVDALTMTAAASTSRAKRRAAARSRVQMASVWPVPCRLTWAMAASRSSTTATDSLRSRNSLEKSSSVAAPISGDDGPGPLVAHQLARRRGRRPPGAGTRSATAACTTSDSAALHTDGRCVLALTRISRAWSRSAASST